MYFEIVALFHSYTVGEIACQFQKYFLYRPNEVVFILFSVQICFLSGGDSIVDHYD